MNAFCPFIKDECKTSNCILWKDDKCTVVLFMEQFNIPKENSSLNYEVNEEEKIEIPQEILSATQEELAKELVTYAKANSVDNDIICLEYQITNCFWKEKKILNKVELPEAIQLKIDKVELLADKILRNEMQKREKERLIKEKEQLPALINECVIWARNNNLIKNAKKADIDVFLSEKDIQLMTNTKHQLWSATNVKLKAKF